MIIYYKFCVNIWFISNDINEIREVYEMKKNIDQHFPV